MPFFQRRCDQLKWVGFTVVWTVLPLLVLAIVLRDQHPFCRLLMYTTSGSTCCGLMALWLGVLMDLLDY
jgi:hypothetical protein